MAKLPTALCQLPTKLLKLLSKNHEIYVLEILNLSFKHEILPVSYTDVYTFHAC